MASPEVTEFAKWLMDVNMFPVFFSAHFLISCTVVREDCKDISPRFRQKHPFASWFCTVLASVSGVFVANFLFSDPLLDIMKEHGLLIVITFWWYMMNYSPYDVVYKIALFPPVFITASLLQECMRVRMIYLGLKQAAKVYPNAYIIILIGGIIKGNGYGFIRVVERLIRGKWQPQNNDILDVTYFGKTALYASLLFLLHHFQVIDISIEILYLGIFIAFVIGRLLYIFRGMKDPLTPIESPICSILFGRADKMEVAEPVKEPAKMNGKGNKKKD